MLVAVRIIVYQFGQHRLHVLRDQAKPVAGQRVQRLAAFFVARPLVLLVGGVWPGGQARVDVCGEVAEAALTPPVPHRLQLADQVQCFGDRSYVSLEAHVGRPGDTVVGRPPSTD